MSGWEVAASNREGAERSARSKEKGQQDHNESRVVSSGTNQAYGGNKIGKEKDSAKRVVISEAQSAVGGGEM